MSISDAVRVAGTDIASAAPTGLADALNSALNQFIGNDFAAGPGHIVDPTTKRSEEFATIVHTGRGATGPMSVPSDTVAAAIDLTIDLTIEQLQESYRRIADAKTLAKTPVPRGETRTNVTLGIIFAARSVLSLDTIAEELARLNGQTPSARWPDMIVVGNAIINYAVQFPSESVSGDFLPPAEGATADGAPAVYIVTVMRPTGEFTFNKMLAYLLGHLGIFSPAVVSSLPDWNQIQEGVPKTVVTHSGYQYNLRGDLAPVPREFHNDRYLSPRPYLIESPDGEALAAVQYLPWADGGAVLLHGKLPLEGLLVFFGKAIAGRSKVVKLKNGQLSYVLPINEADFGAWLTRVQRQSNMRVKKDPGGFVVQKLADEGVGSPFMARTFLGILRLREFVYPDQSKRDGFDKTYDYVTSALSSARSSAQKLKKIWEDHARKVETGEVAKLVGRDIHVQENIDKELRSEIETFLNAATRCLKTGMQNISKELGVSIGFLFQKADAFENGIAMLQNTDPDLAEYLRQTRAWSEPMLKNRIDLEHGTWVLPRTTYRADGSGVKAGEPSIADKSVSEFVEFTFDRLCCFVEELTAHCLRRRMPPGVTLTELPLAQRSPEAPERFQITLAAGGLLEWRITSHQSRFEET